MNVDHVDQYMVSNSKIETKKIAENFAKKILRLRSGQRAVIIGLSGELGSGKTTFAQFFAKNLGVKERVHSPTFVILKRYTLHVTRYENLIHVDAYRIKNSKEIIALGWKKIISDKKNIILVEWAENIKKIFPKKHFWINLKHLAPAQRSIDIIFVK